MQKTDFIALLNTPASVTAKQTEELNDIIDQFPYFQTARLLHLKGLNNKSSLSFDSHLKTTAIHCYDRENLYYYILQKDLSEKIAAAEEEIIQPKIEVVSGKVEVITEKDNSEKPVEVISPADHHVHELKVNELEALIIEEAVSSSISIEVDAILEEKPFEKQKKETKKLPKKDVTPISSEPKSFLDWLKQDKEDVISEEITEKEKNIESIIDAFITADPQMPKVKNEFFSPTNLARLSVVDKNEFVTETLAKIYVQQGDFEKAIKAFQQLSLNSPEKSTYFADQIKLIKKQIKNK